MTPPLDSLEVKIPQKEYYPPVEKMGAQLTYVQWEEGSINMEDLLREVQRKIPLLERQVIQAEEKELGRKERTH